MDQAAIAQRVNDVGRALIGSGDRVVIRRLRELLEAGDKQHALVFVRRAAQAERVHSEALNELAGVLDAWLVGRERLDALTADPAWVEGVAAETHPSRVITAATHPPTLAGLAASLADQQRALAAGESVPSAPDALVAPEALPPLPDAGGRTAARAELGRIATESIPGRRAIVEAPSLLTERPLNLDDDLTDIEPPAKLEAAVELPADDGVAAAPAQISPPPELHRPPEMVSPPTASSQTGRGRVLGLIITLLVLGGAAAYYFLRDLL